MATTGWVARNVRTTITNLYSNHTITTKNTSRTHRHNTHNTWTLHTYKRKTHNLGQALAFMTRKTTVLHGTHMFSQTRHVWLLYAHLTYSSSVRRVHLRPTFDGPCHNIQTLYCSWYLMRISTRWPSTTPRRVTLPDTRRTSSEHCFSYYTIAPRICICAMKVSLYISTRLEHIMRTTTGWHNTHTRRTYTRLHTYITYTWDGVTILHTVSIVYAHIYIYHDTHM